MGRIQKRSKGAYLAGKAIFLAIYFVILALGIYFLNKDEKYYVMVTATLIITTLWVIAIFATMHSREHGMYATMFTIMYLLGLFVIHTIHWIYFYGLDFIFLWLILLYFAVMSIIAIPIIMYRAKKVMKGIRTSKGRGRGRSR